MRAFKFKESFEDFEYPEELKQIYEYLISKGTLNISLTALDDLYRDFCDECYCAAWLVLNDDILKYFANWLSEYEI